MTTSPARPAAPRPWRRRRPVAVPGDRRCRRDLPMIRKQHRRRRTPSRRVVRPISSVFADVDAL